MSDKMKNIVRYGMTCGLIGVGFCLMVCVMTLLGLGHPNCDQTVEGYTWFWLTLWACTTIAAAGSVPLACVFIWITRKLCFQ